MKSIVFSIRRGERHTTNSLGSRHLNIKSMKSFFEAYAVWMLFLLIFVLGIVLGAFSFSRLSDGVLERLDFLFITNLSNRNSLSAFDLFCSSFASDFIFIFSAFLLSFACWGMFALPLLCAFNGFGVGISSAYLFSQYSITGIGFYILVVLPGTVLFLFAFILGLKEAFGQSVLLLRSFFSPSYDALLLRNTKSYLYRNCLILLFTVFSAVIDMMLWVLFAGMFNF